MNHIKIIILKETIMTNKKNLLLLVFMAVFLFSCATEDPTTDFTDRLEPARPISPGNGAAFTTALKDLRDFSFVNGATTVRSARELERSYLITQFNESGPWLVLYINKNNTSGNNADINMGFDANGLTTALTQAENTAEYFDPRKLLFTDSENKVRMGWAGRAGSGTSDTSPQGTAVNPITSYDGLRTVAHTETGRNGSFGVISRYSIQRYDQITYTPRGGMQTTIAELEYMKMDSSGIVAAVTINDGSQSWGWATLDFASQTAGAFVSINSKTSYGRGGGADAFIYGAYNATGIKRSTRATVDELKLDDSVNGKNNFSPVGKLVMGRRNDGYTPSGSTTLFFVPIVGYNLRIANATDDQVSTLLPSGLAASGVASLHQFYMEFDNTTVADASADGFTDAINFPFWGTIDAADGASVDRSGTQVKKFTGFLLKTL